MTTPTQPTTPPTISPLMRTLLDNRKGVRIGLLVAAAALAAGPVVQMASQGLTDGLKLWWIYLLAMAAVAAAVGLFDAIGEETDEAAKADRLRVELMILGGTLGLVTALFGFMLPLTAPYRDQIAAGLESWRANPKALIYPGAAVFGGLLLMLLSVQLVRGMERRSQALRRIVYGYNVALTTVLLLAVLALPNVLAYAEPFGRYFGRPYDWTHSQVHSISPLMRNFVAELKEPVRAYVMLDKDNAVGQDTITLLDHFKSVNPKFTYELISAGPEKRAERQRMMARYNIDDPHGVLLVVGDEGDKAKPAFAFVKITDLIQERGAIRDRGEGMSYVYSGENAIYNALSGLIYGKLVIYFTSGHGELTTDGGTPPGFPRNAMRGKGGLTRLRDRLTERKNVEVKTFDLDGSGKKVPDDASVLVVARPTQTFGPADVAVLRDYAKRNATMEKVKDDSGQERDVEKVTAGKIIFLVPPSIQRTGGNSSFVPTGLEGLLSEYGVTLNNDRLLVAHRRAPDPLQVLATPDPNSPNPIAKSFTESDERITLFLFENTRSLTPIDAKGGGGRNVDNVLVAYPPNDIVQDTTVVEPTEYVERLLSDPEKLQKARVRRLVPVGLAVSDGGGPPDMPRDAAHSRQLKGVPRMVVFGSSAWLGDEMIERGSGLELFNGSVSWLREQASGLKIEAKQRKLYDLNIPPQEAGKVVYLPLALMLLTVVGLGTGVWVVRRR